MLKKKEILKVNNDNKDNNNNINKIAAKINKNSSKYIVTIIITFNIKAVQRRRRVKEKKKRKITNNLERS